jgi:putative transposase
MRRSRYTEEQIVAILKEHEAGVGTEELYRRHGISQQTFYRWKAKYGGLDTNETHRLRALEDENRRLKRLVADLSLDNAALKDVLSKNW